MNVRIGAAVVVGLMTTGCAARQAPVAAAGAEAYPVDEARRIVMSQLSSIQQCYAESVDRDPSLGGDLEVVVQIAPAGTASLTSKSGTMQDEEILVCIETKIESLRFPQHDTPPEALDFRFTFTP